MGFKADKTPDHAGTSNQSLKPWPELGGVGRLLLGGAALPRQSHPGSPGPTLLLSMKKCNAFVSLLLLLLLLFCFLGHTHSMWGIPG